MKAASEDHLEWDALIGIVTAIIGNVFISFALNLQRYAHIRLNRNKLRRPPTLKHEQERWQNERYREDGWSHNGEAQEEATLSINPGPEVGGPGEQHLEERSPLRGNPLRRLSSDGDGSENETHGGQTYLRSPYWWAGITLMVIGEAGNFLAYGFAPASIVSPLGVVALVSNCIIAPCLLRERFRQQDLWGVLIAIAGVVTVVLSAKHSEDRMGPNDIWDAITRWEFQLYLGLTAGAMVGLVWLSSRYGNRTVLIDVGLVALFGGYTALSTKGVASLLSGTLWRALTFPITYLLAFVLAATALLQIRYLNQALQRFNSTQVIPTQFVLFTISVIVGSAILYRDFESADAERIGKFVGGCALTFLGVYFITSGRSGDESQGEAGLGGGEEGIHLMDEEHEPPEPTKPHPFSSDEQSIESSQAYDRRPTPQSIASRRSSRYGAVDGSYARSSNTSDAGTTLSSRNAPMTSEEPPNFTTPTKPPLPKSSTTSSVLPTTRHGSSPPQQPDSPSRPGVGGRPVNLSKHRSISRLVPGPLSSPLSSPLSGIVRDTLQRGLDSPLRARAARLPGLRRWRSDRDQEEATEGTTGSPPVGSTVRSQVPFDGAEPNTARANRRTRSVSGALENVFHLRRSGESDNGEAGNSEAGNGEDG